MPGFNARATAFFVFALTLAAAPTLAATPVKHQPTTEATPNEPVTPPATPEEPAPLHKKEDTRPKNVLVLLEAHKELHQFVGLIQDTDVAAQLASPSENLTVFAPTDEALKKLPADLQKKLKDKTERTRFVRYHMIAGSRVFADNIRGRRASPSSAAGEMLSFDGVSGPDPKVNGTPLTTPNLEAQNGVVHIIAQAFIPTTEAPTPSPAPSIGETAAKPALPNAAELSPATPATTKAPSAPTDTSKTSEKTWFQRMLGR
jgi:uncharacterized surface protein with fasciclin (FAS1) repeats